jgi:hypothetical protein
MTTSDKKKAVMLIALIAVGVALYVWMYRSKTVATTGATRAKAEAKGAGIKPGQEAQIHLDWIEDIASAEVGRKNLFQYRQKTVPAKPVEATIRPITTQPPPVAYTPPTPVTPPPPPFPAFRYEGVSGVKGGKLLASITESGTTYTVRESECLKGQYCISKLTENLVEIEDLQLKRRQTFTRAQ